MCHVSCILYVAENIERNEIEGKDVIEVGSYDVNGSVRSIVGLLNPKKYIGVDIKDGPGVDFVCDASSLVDKFGKESFDVVISTELMEHVRDWKTVISNIKKICKPEGTIIITTRSRGFHFHAYPYDFWRYEKEDMQKIFSDFKIFSLKDDPEASGVFVKMRKENSFIENDLKDISLFSMIVGKRISSIQDSDFKSCYLKKLIFKEKLENFVRSILRFFYSFLK
ncbi:MAG: methyltransferase domain-containing protein [Candidatus Paceibacterota bacterium]|jgi:predicted SAM-dependent methyltransferase